MEAFSLNKLAESFEVDRGTLVKAMRGVKPDMEKTKGRPLWKVATTAKALATHRAKTNGGSNPSGAGSETLVLTKERSRLARAQAIKIEHENKITGDDWYHVDDVVKVTADLFMIVREHLLSLPGKCADRLASHSKLDRGAITDTLRQEVYAALTALAGKKPWALKDDERNEDGTEEDNDNN